MALSSRPSSGSAPEDEDEEKQEESVLRGGTSSWGKSALRIGRMLEQQSEALDARQSAGPMERRKPQASCGQSQCSIESKGTSATERSRLQSARLQSLVAKVVQKELETKEGDRLGDVRAMVQGQVKELQAALEATLEDVQIQVLKHVERLSAALANLEHRILGVETCARSAQAAAYPASEHSSPSTPPLAATRTEPARQELLLQASAKNAASRRAASVALAATVQRRVAPLSHHLAGDAFQQKLCGTLSANAWNSPLAVRDAGSIPHSDADSRDFRPQEFSVDERIPSPITDNSSSSTSLAMQGIPQPSPSVNALVANMLGASGRRAALPAMGPFLSDAAQHTPQEQLKFDLANVLCQGLQQQYLHDTERHRCPEPEWAAVFQSSPAAGVASGAGLEKHVSRSMPHCGDIDAVVL